MEAKPIGGNRPLWASQGIAGNRTREASQNAKGSKRYEASQKGVLYLEVEVQSNYRFIVGTIIILTRFYEH